MRLFFLCPIRDIEKPKLALALKPTVRFLGFIVLLRLEGFAPKKNRQITNSHSKEWLFVIWRPIRESEPKRACLFIMTVRPQTLAFSNPCGFERVRPF